MAKRRTLLKDKRKKVKVKLIQRLYDGKPTEPYRILETVISRDRPDLADVKFALAWNNGWRADADGLLTLGKCSKRKDLDRELDEYDFIIMLNENAWPGLSDENKERLIFHELCHAQICYDKSNQPLLDDRGRLVCRVRKHDFEDFSDCITKYGFKESMSQIAKAAVKAADQPLIDEIEKKQKEKKDKEPSDFEKDDYNVNSAGIAENPMVIEVKLPKSYGTKISISWAKYEGKYYIGLDIDHRTTGIHFPVDVKNVPPFDTLSDALITAQDKICAFIKENKFKHDKQIRTKVIKAVENYLEGQK